MPDGVGKQWGSLRQTRPWRYAASLTGMLHLVSLALSVLCVAFAGHYLGMYQGVHVPGYDLFRPEAFFVIAGVACMVVTTLLLATVLASAESQELLFRTLAPELAFGVMSGLWLVASIVYMAEIVGRNMDYLFRERGFPLKILTARRQLWKTKVLWLPHNLAIFFACQSGKYESTTGAGYRIKPSCKAATGVWSAKAGVAE